MRKPLVLYPGNLIPNPKTEPKKFKKWLNWIITETRRKSKEYEKEILQKE